MSNSAEFCERNPANMAPILASARLFSLYLDSFELYLSIINCMHFEHFCIEKRSDVIILHIFFPGQWMVRKRDRMWRLETLQTSQPTRKPVKAPAKNRQFGKRLASEEGQVLHRRHFLSVNNLCKLPVVENIVKLYPRLLLFLILHLSLRCKPLLRIQYSKRLRESQNYKLN